MAKPNLKYFAKDLIESELIRNTSVLISGTVIASLISILLQPFLRRYFSPEAFGTYSVYLSLVSIIAVITPLRYNDAIVLPKDDKASANVLFLSMVFNFFINLLLFVIILLSGRKLIIMLNIHSDLPVSILYLIPLSIFLLNTYQSFNYWLIRMKKYYPVTAVKIVRRSSEGIAQVVFALFRNPKGLIYSDIIGQAANAGLTVYYSFRYGFNLRLIEKKAVYEAMRDYSEFPKYNLIPGIMSACSFYLPTIFINRYYSPEFTGYFDLSKLLLSLPIAFIAAPVSNVLLQKVSEKIKRSESFMADLKPLVYIIGIIGIVQIAAILLFSSGIFRIAFGSNWDVSAEISRMLVWSLTLNFIVSSFSCIFISMQKIKIYSIWQTVYFISILILLFFRDLSFSDFIGVYVVIESVCYIMLIGLMLWLILRYEHSLSDQRIS